ncbi:hypothetical protein EVG20_g3302 [Dentipellis fragilis]|uniref:Large ribosomal subunit protein uL29m n=1 Tax=Dentipellis fragilis TaxID=205917 RepID=A0A4Y9Z4N8_9AGAM|nr:hypothetical protein EVG20_g3302 [Dentipellis fragilis]
MPIASSSRRRRAADPASDIEEDASQRMDEDAVEEQPRKRSTAVAKVKAERKPDVQAGSDNDEGEEEPADDEPPINEENFGNQPIDRQEAAKLNGMASDWTMMEETLRRSAFGLLTEVASAVAEFEDPDNVEKELKRLDLLMREVVDIDMEFTHHSETLKDLQQRIHGDEEIAHYLTTSKSLTGSQEVQNPDKAMPPVIELLPKENGDASDDDDDEVQVGGVTQDLKCPITLTMLVDPVTCEICHHSFSAEAIKTVLGDNKFTKKKCPAAGCNKMISFSDCKPDKELARKVKIAQRRAQRREADSDEEEIVEPQRSVSGSNTQSMFGCIPRSAMAGRKLVIGQPPDAMKAEASVLHAATISGPTCRHCLTPSPLPQPFARYSAPPPAKLPSLLRWKDVCTSLNSANGSPSLSVSPTLQDEGRRPELTLVLERSPTSQGKMRRASHASTSKKRKLEEVGLGTPDEADLSMHGVTDAVVAAGAFRKTLTTMLCSFRSQFSRYLSAATHVRRYSTPLDVIPASSQTQKADGALRPHLNFPVKSDHGLWAFFRQREKDGKLVYESIETEQGLFDKSGRSWSAAELRRKSFRDLHTLWYVLVRERNLLATQGAELRRLGIPSAALSVSSLRETQCRKSMARIKYVINERRLAYEGAVNKFAEEKDMVVKAERRERKASRRAERREQRKNAVETKKESTVSEAATLAADALLKS